MKNRMSCFFLVFLLTLLFVDCGNKNISEAHLRKRIIDFYDLMRRGKFENSWDYLMGASKESWRKEKWVLFWLRGSKNRKMLEYRLGTIRIEKINKAMIARAKVVLKILDLSSNKTYLTDHESEWAFENGDWFRFEDV